MCVEILMLLAASESQRFLPRQSSADASILGFTGREALRNRGTYTVIKLAHEAETDANVCSGAIPCPVQALTTF